MITGVPEVFLPNIAGALSKIQRQNDIKILVRTLISEAILDGVFF